MTISASYSITASTPLALSMTQCTPFDGLLIEPTGGQAPYAFSVSSGVLPAGLQLNGQTGELSGAPLSVAAAASVVVRVTDSLGAYADLAPISISVAHEGAWVSNWNDLKAAVQAITTSGVVTLDADGDFTDALSSTGEHIFTDIAPSGQVILRGSRAPFGQQAWLPSVRLKRCKRMRFEYLNFGENSLVGGCLIADSDPAMNFAEDIEVLGCDFYGAYWPMTPPDAVTIPPTNRQGFVGRFKGLKVYNSNFEYLFTGISPDQSIGPNAVERIGNTFSNSVVDTMQLSWDLANPQHGCKFNYNIMSRYYAKGEDLYPNGSGGYSPHADAIQVRHDGDNAGGAHLDDGEIIGNVCYDGSDARSTPQFILMRAQNAVYRRWKIAGNLRIARDGGDSHLVALLDGSADQCYVFGNAGGYHDPSTVAAQPLTINVAPRPDGRGNFVGSNLATDMPPATSSAYPNVEMVRASQSSFFDGPFEPDTNEAAIAGYRFKTSGPMGFLRDYIDHAGQSYDASLEPGWLPNVQLTGQPVSGVATTGWIKLLAGGADQPYVVTGGRVRFADEENGANATAWTSDPGVVSQGKFIDREVATSSLGYHPTSMTLTIKGMASTFQATTVGVLSFPRAKNSGVAYSKLLNFEPAGLQTASIITLAVRYRQATFNSAARIVGTAGSSGIRLGTTSNSAPPSGFLNTSGTGRANFMGDGPGASAHTAVLTYDFTKTTAAEVAKLVVDGNTKALDPSSTLSLAGTLKLSGGTVYADLGAFALGSGSNLFNGEIEMIWSHYGLAGTYTPPDFSDPEVFKMFSADYIGADGEGPLGFQPKYCFYGPVGAADGTEPDTWNASGGLLNRGSVPGASLIRQAGTYVVGT